MYPLRLTVLLNYLAVAGLYVLTGWLSLFYFVPSGGASVFFIASGLALAVLLYGGQEYLVSILLGAVLLNSLQGKTWLVAVIIAIGSTSGAWLGAWLLTKNPGFNHKLSTLRDFLLLVALGGCVACSLSALVGVLTLWYSGIIGTNDVVTSLLYWWMGDTLGVILITPFLLVWWHPQELSLKANQYGETIAIVMLNLLAGQLIFLDWFHENIGSYAKNYWLFLFVSWAAVRLGSRATTFILVTTATQAMIGLVQQRANFLQPGLGDHHALNYWFFMVALSIVGMALATYFSERQHMLNAFRDQKEFLRTLLQVMPDMVWLKNADGVYLLCNHNFESLYGASEAQLIGKTDSDFVTETTAASFREHDAKALSTGQPCTYEEWLSFADGSHTGLYVTTKTPVFSRNGQLLGVLGVAHEITELRQTQQALRERIQEQACLHAIFQATEDSQKPLAEVLQTVVELLPSGWREPDQTSACIEWADCCYRTGNFLATADNYQVPIVIDNHTRGYVAVAYSTANQSLALTSFRQEHIALLNAVAERLASNIRHRLIRDDAHQREELFQAIVAQATEAITLFDADTLHVLEFNDAACDSLGYRREDFAKLRLPDLQSEFDTATLFNMIREFKRTGAAQFDTLRRRNDSALRYVHVSLKMISFKSQDYISIIWSDITERKQIEEQFRHLFSQNPAPLLIYERASLAIVAVNDAFTDLYGYSQGEACALRLTDLFSEQDQSAIAALASDLQGFVKIGEWRQLLKNRTFIDVIASSHDIFFAERACRVMVMTDISERKQAEAQLRKLWLAVEQSPNSIIITNLNAEIEYVNRRFTEVTGYSASEVIGQNPRLLQSGQTSKDCYETMWQNLSAGRSWAGELINRRKDGRDYIEWAQITPVRQADEQITHYLAIKEDITDKKQADAELARYRHHLEELVAARTEELELARQQAEAANIAKSQFLANMSHEIRTPMNAILGMLYLALKQECNPTLYNYLTKAQGAAQSLLEIINDILDFSKIESGKLTIEAIEFTLETLLKELTTSIALHAEQKGIEFLIRYDANLPTLLIGDPLRLGQILLNLCNNAIKFTEAGEVELAFLALHRHDNDLTLQISVRDTGIGIEPEVQQRLFQKFSQADQSITRQYGGTGLGLVICKNLVELMGGRIWIEDSQPGKGTTICCTVQLKIAAQAHNYSRELLALSSSLLKDIRVLVVDDNEAARDIIADMLQQMHIQLDRVSNGLAAIDALEQAKDQPFDLVLLDWLMPGINGDEVTRRIRNNKTIRPQPKIIMVTAYGRDDVIRLAEMAGVNGFILKPLSPSALLDTMLLALGRGRLLDSEHHQHLQHEAVDYGRAHILLVEDNAINREFAVELLHSLNIQVDEAFNGADAVDKVQRQNYALVLMDVQMPVMDGLTATQTIRDIAKQTHNERLEKLPIIAMTALAMAEDKNRCLQAGMTGYITKPIEAEQLIKILNEWLPPLQAQLSVEHKSTPAFPSELLAMTSVDCRQGIRRIGGHVEAYQKQLQRFKERYANALDDLQRLLTEQGFAAAEAYCHGLKGVCGNLAANQLFTCVSHLDDKLRREIPPDAEQFSELNDLLQKLLAEISQVNAVAPVPVASEAKLQKDQLLVKLAILSTLLESDLGAAEQVIKEIRAGVVDTPFAAIVSDIAAHIDVFAIDNALAQIHALQQRLNDAETLPD